LTCLTDNVVGGRSVEQRLVRIVQTAVGEGFILSKLGAVDIEPVIAGKSDLVEDRRVDANEGSQVTIDITSVEDLAVEFGVGIESCLSIAVIDLSIVWDTSSVDDRVISVGEDGLDFRCVKSRLQQVPNVCLAGNSADQREHNDSLHFCGISGLVERNERKLWFQLLLLYFCLSNVNLRIKWQLKH